MFIVHKRLDRRYYDCFKRFSPYLPVNASAELQRKFNPEFVKGTIQYRDFTESTCLRKKHATNRRDKTTAQKSCNICTYKC